MNALLWKLLQKIDRLFLRARVRGELHDANQLLKRARSVGSGTHMWGAARITGIENCVFGSNVHIGNNAFIRAEGGLRIGDNTHISRNLLLYTINHRYNGRRLPYDEEIVHRPVEIGRNVWIGMNVCITPGTKIGEGAIIGMGCVVSGEVPPLAIVGSEKWRILARRDEAEYRELEMAGEYGGADGIKFEESKLESKKL